MQAPCEPHLIAAKRLFSLLKRNSRSVVVCTTCKVHLQLSYRILRCRLRRFKRWSSIHYWFGIFIGPNLISWRAKKQATISRPTVEAEYRSIAFTTAELMWYVDLFQSLGHSVPIPILHCDNKSAINIAKNLVFHHRTKHIEIDVHCVREQVARCVIKLARISGDNQIAEFLQSPKAARVPTRPWQALYWASPSLSLRGNVETYQSWFSTIHDFSSRISLVDHDLLLSSLL